MEDDVSRFYEFEKNVETERATGDWQVMAEMDIVVAAALASEGFRPDS